MRQIGVKIALLFLLLGFISCRSWYVVTIETRKPAAVFMPGPVDGVVVVNNAVSQPPDVGITLAINKTETNLKQTIETDTTLRNAITILAQTIQNENYFSKTLIYEKALRKDNEWLSLMSVPNQLCDSIYQEAECNMIISVDRLLFNLQETVLAHTENRSIDPMYVFPNVKCDASMTCSVYYIEKDKRLTTFTVRDSVFFNEFFPYDSLLIYKYLPNQIIKETVKIIAEKAAAYFTPGWETADRIIYTSYRSRMQEADRYFANQKWQQARTIWEQQYNDKEENIDKARLAVNIAVSFEMEDDLTAAINWAERAKDIYGKIKSEKIDEERKRVDKYIAALSVRTQHWRMLDMQRQHF